MTFWLFAAPTVPSAPQNLSCIFLVQQSEISATCTWEPPASSDVAITAYRALYARKLPMTEGDSVLVLDRNNYVMKVLDDVSVKVTFQAIWQP